MQAGWHGQLVPVEYREVRSCRSRPRADAPRVVLLPLALHRPSPHPCSSVSDCQLQPEPGSHTTTPAWRNERAECPKLCAVETPSSFACPHQASPVEVRAAFRRLALLLHPDRRCGSAAEFLRIKEAADTLLDPARRAAYDELLSQRLCLSCEDYLEVGLCVCVLWRVCRGLKLSLDVSKAHAAPLICCYSPKVMPTA